MNADGSDLTTLLHHDFAYADGALVSAPAWSPDSQRIAFVHSDVEFETPELYVMDSDGNNARLLVKSPLGQISAPSWAPHNGLIAFVRDVGMYIVDAGGGEPSHIFNGIPYLPRHWSQSSDWSPDGSTIWFSTKSDCTALGVHSFDPSVGPAIQRLLGAQQPAWSPDGARLAFSSPADAYPPITMPARVYNLDGVHSDGSKSRYVLYDDGNFNLQFTSLNWGTFGYGGRYSGENPIAFQMEWDNAPEPWRATGTVDGTRLSIRYNWIADLIGFENGGYELDESQQ